MDINDTNPERHSFPTVRQAVEVALAIFALGSLCAFLRICFDTVVSPESSADAKRWAQSVIAGIVGALVGALIRR